MKNKKDSAILWNIKELYEWAVERGVEEYTLFRCDEGGMAGNCFIFDIDIDEDKETILL